MQKSVTRGTSYAIAQIPDLYAPGELFAWYYIISVLVANKDERTEKMLAALVADRNLEAS